MDRLERSVHRCIALAPVLQDLTDAVWQAAMRDDRESTEGIQDHAMQAIHDALRPVDEEPDEEVERLRAVEKAARGYVKAQTARRANRAVIDGERRVQLAYVDLRRVLADLPDVDSATADETAE